jgi:hypothetical protein
MDFTDSEVSSHAAPRMKLAQKQTKATKKNSSFVSFVPFCSREIRVIREIRGKTFAKRSDFWQHRDNGEDPLFALFAPVRLFFIKNPYCER